MRPSGFIKIFVLRCLRMLPSIETCGYRRTFSFNSGVVDGVVEVNSTAGKAYFDALHAGQDFEQQAGDGGGRCVAAGGIEGVEDLGTGDLDGAAVFEDAEPEVPVHFDGRRGGELVEAGGVLAIGLGAQSRCVALGSVGHDGPA